MNISDLRKKYGAAAVDAGLAVQPGTFERRLRQRDSLDQHFTKLWLDFAITGMYQRPALDKRTRCLVLIGQFTMGKSHAALDDAVRAALKASVKPREILEVILHCAIYGGHTTVDPAIDVFHKIAEEMNLLDALRESQLPMDGTDRSRSYDEEAKTWHPDDLADPRFAAMKEHHGWLGLGRGLTLRPKNHLAVLANYTALDPEWGRLWERFCYQGMYSRGIVDDKTRLLCMVGNCVAIGEEVNARAHMRGAMHNGAKPREVLEVLLMTTVNFGMPTGLAGVDIFVEYMDQEGRLAEIGNPAPRSRLK